MRSKVGTASRTSHDAPADLRPALIQLSTENPESVSANKAANVTLRPRRAFQIHESAEKGFKRRQSLPWPVATSKHCLDQVWPSRTGPLKFAS